MTKFRPCIDLHEGKVKQIVGGTLRDGEAAEPPSTAGTQVNFETDQTADWFARKYREDGLTGGHVIKLGPGNDHAARSALSAYPGGLQLGGGVTISNASLWLDAGASHVIVTSWLFDSEARFQLDRLKSLDSKVGKDKIVIDLSCRKTESGWTVAMDRWQTMTDLVVNSATLNSLSEYCDEFLIHAADVEGLCNGIDVDLVQLMGDWGEIPMTYAGGVANMNDVRLVDSASTSKVDVTVGSSLDLFGGSGVEYDDLVNWSKRADS